MFKNLILSSGNLAFDMEIQHSQITIHCIFVQKIGCSFGKCDFIEYVATWHNAFSASILTSEEWEANSDKRGFTADTTVGPPMWSLISVSLIDQGTQCFTVLGAWLSIPAVASNTYSASWKSECFCFISAYLASERTSFNYKLMSKHLVEPLCNLIRGKNPT